jgi:hypothetical protein
MSVSGISGSSFLQAPIPANIQSKFQFQLEFQQLGQDLQSGNLSQAQGDVATLQQNAPTGAAVSGASSNSISQAFNALAQDLKSGKLSAAQSDFANIQQDLQQNAAQATRGHHHHRHHSCQADASQQSSSSGPGSVIDQAFGQLGQALQAGNLPVAQQAYATLQQDFQQFAALGASSSSGSSTPATATPCGLNITV